MKMDGLLVLEMVNYVSFISRTLLVFLDIDIQVLKLTQEEF
jgi:hypothetical protein